MTADVSGIQFDAIFIGLVGIVAVVILTVRFLRWVRRPDDPWEKFGRRSWWRG